MSYDSVFGTLKAMLNFQPDYIFDTFVVTPNNEMAFSAANAIVDEMGTRFNPFFLYGAFGSGKTHLLHAIGNAAIKKRTGLRILLVSGRDFAADIATGLKRHKLPIGLKKPMTTFYQHYQNYDLLMIDGLEAIAYDDVAQNVALRLFDAVQKHNGQIIATTRVPTHRFPVMESYFREAYTTELIGEILAPEALVKNRHLLWRAE
jgi:chromosomal replication initiator protein